MKELWGQQVESSDYPQELVSNSGDGTGRKGSLHSNPYGKDSVVNFSKQLIIQGPECKERSPYNRGQERTHTQKHQQKMSDSTQSSLKQTKTVLLVKLIQGLHRF